jgi:glutamine amidotransferase
VNVNVTVVDYGIGNLHSVVKALRHEGAEVRVESSPQAIAAADRLVLPGVGAFGDGARELARRELVEPLRAFVAKGRPFLGICLGMQLLLKESEEFGNHQGLGLIDGCVVAMKAAPSIKIPHIGWNRIAPPAGGSWKATVFDGIEPGTMVYFVHSFAAMPASTADILCETTHGGNCFAAGVHRANVVGCQFHPEKSGATGLLLLRRFVKS